MKIGTEVCLVGTDGFMPPIGACGVIVSEIDSDDDYLVSFPDYPCPTDEDPCWFAHKSWLIPLTPLATTNESLEVVCDH